MSIDEASLGRLLDEAAIRDATARIAEAATYADYNDFRLLWPDDADWVMIAKPVLLAATAGTARHALVVDEAMRSLFSYMRALPVPTGVFATPEDWASVELGARIDRAAGELLAFAESGVEDQIELPPGVAISTNWAPTEARSSGSTWTARSCT